MKKHLLLMAFALLITDVPHAWGQATNTDTGSDIGLPPGVLPITTREGKSGNPRRVVRPKPEEPVRPPRVVKGPDVLQRQQEWAEQQKTNPTVSRLEPRDITGLPVETRACADTDIMGGVLKMVYFRETPPKLNDRMNRRIRHQYLSFTTSHYYSKLKSSRSIDDPQKAIAMMKPNMDEKFAEKYIFSEKDGKAEIVMLSGKKAVARQSCSVVVKPLNVFVPGDIILTGYTRGGKTLLYQLFRRWF
jgi:hypothetical protein